MKKQLFFLSLTMLSVGCAGKVMILETPVISMTKADAGSAKDLRQGTKVEERWCNSDDPVHPNDDGSKDYGLIDQVVWKAHKKTRADFFVQNRFYQQGDCGIMSAYAAYAGESPAGESAAPAAEHHKGKAKAGGHKKHKKHK